MFSFHKPKIYRSTNGCCICKAKSSSSRFTDSSKYEQDFEKCFRIREKRCGEICNACVLLVKRWKKLPDGTNRHWNHVVDARAGPGTKSTLKMKNKLSPTMHKYKSPLKPKSRSSTPTRLTYDSVSSPLPGDTELSGHEDSLDKSDVFRQRLTTDSEESDTDNAQIPARSRHRRHQRPPVKLIQPKVSPFLDLTYWTMTKVCCGMVFKGMNGEVILDSSFYKPCRACGVNKQRTTSRSPTKTNDRELTRSSSMEDSDTNSSTDTNSTTDTNPSITDTSLIMDTTSVTTGFTTSDEFYEGATPNTETPPDSPPDSPEHSLSEASSVPQIQPCSNMFVTHDIPMEY